MQGNILPLPQIQDLPLVSVIIPNYNHAKYLKQRIDSVLNQSYPNFEVIILDDCSPDNGKSREIIETYRENKHIAHIVYNEKNSGSTFIQWEKGFELAKGEWIWIAESDDLCELNFLETLIKISDKSDVISFCQTFYVDEIGNIINESPSLLTRFLNLFSHKRFISRHSSKEFIQNNLLFGTTICNASMAIFRKDVAISIPSDYLNYKAAGDRYFWLLISERGNIVQCNEKLNYFRQHHNKVSPRCILDGTTVKEDYLINEYICKTQRISTIRRFLMKCSYYKRYHSTYQNNPKLHSNLSRYFYANNKLIEIVAPFSPKLISLLNKISSVLNNFR